MIDELRIIIPGLGTGPGVGHGHGGAQGHALDRLLARMRARGSNRPGATDTSSAVFAALGETGHDHRASAAIEVHGAGLDAAAVDATGWICRAEPIAPGVYTDHVRLAAPSTLTATEARELAAALARLWRDDGVDVQVVTPGCWYLRWPPDPGAPGSGPAAGVPPLAAVAGRRPDEVLAGDTGTGPAGSVHRRLWQLLTESQMLFHAHPVNAARRARGADAGIAGVWLSGGGRLPRDAPRLPAVLAGDDLLLRGLARLAGREVAALPEGHTALPAAECALVVLPALDQPGPHDDAAAVATRWLTGAWAALARGRLRRLCWWNARGAAGALNRLDPWRVWRRTPAPPVRDSGATGIGR